MSLNDYVQQLIGAKEDEIVMDSEPFFRFVLPFPDEVGNDA